MKLPAKCSKKNDAAGHRMSELHAALGRAAYGYCPGKLREEIN
jgi:hypothetical protein